VSLVLVLIVSIVLHKSSPLYLLEVDNRCGPTDITK
jgi:hypothetical protein